MHPGTGRTTSRGYGYQHVKARKDALRNLRDGDPCHFCGRPMFRAQARDLHLDHTPDRTTYRGLTHAHCNIADAGRRSHQPAARHSRTW